MTNWQSNAYVSGSLADGSSVFVRIESGYTVAVRFLDDGSLRDVTEWLPDLVATGLIAQSRRAIGLDGSPTEVVTVADVELLHVPSGVAGASLDEDILGVAPDDRILQAWIVAPAQRMAEPLPLLEMFAAAAEGVAAMVLDAVAHDEAEPELAEPGDAEPDLAEPDLAEPGSRSTEQNPTE